MNVFSLGQGRHKGVDAGGLAGTGWAQGHDAVTDSLGLVQLGGLKFQIRLDCNKQCYDY